MAHKKGVGSSKNGRDSKGKRLGIKLFGNNLTKPGNIIVRQRGNKYYSGINTYISKDFTIHSKIYGYIKYKKIKKKTYIYVIPII
ncbi:50S ribosomal protein L27 [Candidatus Shikimatogenerans bostrichidophilus]|uniref:50S ribosomal protein L27 n=1 Tax=Candidatus Shikimatogenerans bostrichidophilus TaxID=2943807 RepID=UPI0029668FCD